MRAPATVARSSSVYQSALLRAGRLAQRVLVDLALAVVLDLPHGRLAHIDVGQARAVARGDLLSDGQRHGASPARRARRPPGPGPASAATAPPRRGGAAASAARPAAPGAAGAAAPSGSPAGTPAASSSRTSWRAATSEAATAASARSAGT